MSRYVILLHETPPRDARPTHWDLMLQRDSHLQTWALESLPRAGAEIAAQLLPDHRLAYLDYEGEISRGRGRVSQWDAGEYGLLRDEPERVTVSLAGRRGLTEVELRRIGEGWTARFCG